MAASGFAAQLPEKLTLPDETGWAFASALLLAAGATVYKLACPPSVQRFSEVEWVAQLRRPRLLYIADSLGCGAQPKLRRQRSLQLLTGVTVALGGLLAAVLLLWRIWILGELIWQYRG